MSNKYAGWLKASGRPAFTPEDIAGLACWLQASDVAGNEGDLVPAWVDATRGVTFAQPDPALQPVINSTQVPGRRCIKFDAARGTALHGGDVTLAGEITFFLVTNPGGGYILCLNGDDLNAFVSNYFAPFEWYSYPRYAFADGGRASTNKLSILSQVVTPGSFSGWYDGITSATDLYGPPIDGKTVGVIGNAVSLAAPSEAAIAEIIIYNAALTIEDRRAVERYLAMKWVITLGE